MRHFTATSVAQQFVALSPATARKNAAIAARRRVWLALPMEVRDVEYAVRAEVREIMDLLTWRLWRQHDTAHPF